MRAFAFGIPAAAVLCAVARLGVYPFGNLSMLTVDMNSEYIDYFMQMNKIFREQGSFLRSQDMGMGLNMLGLIAFYTASPLNLLLLAAPVEHLTEAVLLLTLLKFGLCGLTFSFYTSYTFRQNGLVNLGGSVAYALMGYNLAYSSNIMWLDGAALLPLVLLGVEKLLKENKYTLYIVSLVLVFWCSYYIGFMVGVFTFLYFTCRFFTEKTIREHGRAYLGKFGRFLGGAALAAGCCAVLLLPAFLNLCAGQDGMWSISLAEFANFYPLTKLAAKLVPGVYDSLTDSGLPNLFVTTAAALLAVLFFLNKEIPRREKGVFGLFAGVMFLSLSWGILDLAWHAFEIPTWFPARYSFVVSFLLLHLALRGLARPGGYTPARIATGTGLYILLLFEISVTGYAFVEQTSVLLAAFLALCYGSVLLVCRLEAGPRARGAVLAMGFCLLCTECFYNANAQLEGIHGQFGYRTRAGYYAYRDRYLPAVEQVEREHPGVYRMEIAQLRNANGGMALGYHGISHYSTTTDQTLNTLLRKLGYNTGTINEVRFAQNTPLTNGLLGVRYILSADKLNPGYELIDQVGAVGVYENPCAFPLAYFGERAALDADLEEPCPFTLQNQWVSLSLEGAGEPFRQLELEEESLQNLIRDDSLSGLDCFYRPLTDIQGALELNLYNPDALEAYAFFPVSGRRFAKAEAYSDGGYLGKELAYRNNTVLDLGSGEHPQVRLLIDSDRVHIARTLLFGLDFDQARRAADLAWEHPLEFTRFDDTAIDGVITAPRDGILSTTLPYDVGWTVRVDGKKVPTQPVMGAFLAVELPQGEHTVTMRYSPPGFKAGAAISLLCAGGMVAWGLRRRRAERQKPKA